MKPVRVVTLALIQGGHHPRTEAELAAPSPGVGCNQESIRVAALSPLRRHFRGPLPASQGGGLELVETMLLFVLVFLGQGGGSAGPRAQRSLATVSSS